MAKLYPRLPRPLIGSAAGCLLTLFLCLLYSCSSDPDTVRIAQVGDLYVGQEEFELTYQFNPYFISYTDPGQAKDLLLKTLIAEKMLVQEGYVQGLAELPAITQLTEQYKREALIEKFWQEEIKEQIVISEQEVYDAYLRSKRIRFFRYLTFSDGESALRAYQHLDNGLPFTEVAKLNGLDNGSIPLDSITFGSELNTLEEQVFQLPLNGISPPFKMGQYFFVINLIEEKTDIFTSEDDYNRQYRQIKKRIRQRKQFSSFQNYIRKKFSKPPYQLDKIQFKTTGSAIRRDP